MCVCCVARGACSEPEFKSGFESVRESASGGVAVQARNGDQTNRNREIHGTNWLRSVLIFCAKVSMTGASCVYAHVWERGCFA